MKKGETIQKLVLFGAMSIGALLIAEGYLQVRAFVHRVNAADRQIAVLKHDVEFLRVQLEAAPRIGFQPLATPAVTSQVQLQPVVLPLPEPMRFPPAAPGGPQKVARAKDSSLPASSDEPAKSDAVPDDGKIVLMKDTKEPKPAAAPAQQKVAAPTVDVKLWSKK